MEVLAGKQIGADVALLNSMMKFWPFVAALLLVTNAAFGGGGLCRSLLVGDATEAIEAAMRDPEDMETVKSIFYRGEREGLIELARGKGLNWNSSHNPFPNGFNRQGDPRVPLFLFGAKLAKKLDFDIRVVAERGTEVKKMIVPAARRLGNTIKRINRFLIGKGLEAISYLPVSFGYATDSQMLNLSISGGKEFEMVFPYADRDSKLIGHEVAYHLNLLLSKKILSRTRLVTIRNLQFIQLLQIEGAELGEVKNRIIHQILKDRAVELDFGTGNSSTTLGNYRMTYADLENHELPPYKHMDSEMRDELASDIAPMTRAEFTPAMSVAERMITMLSLDPFKAALGIKSGGHSFTPFVGAQSGHGQKISLGSEQRRIVLRVLKSFLQRYENIDESLSASAHENRGMADAMLDHLDQRLEHLLEAARPTEGRP